MTIRQPRHRIGDGWYALGIDPTGNPSNGQTFWVPFFRLLGSATGDLTVTGPYTAAGTDAYTVYHAEGESGALLDADVNGDGSVNTKDPTETVAADGHSVGTTPPSNLPQFQLFIGATAGPGHAVAVTQTQVQALLPAAIAAWQAAGLDAADLRQLEGVSVEVGNLGTSILGLETAGTITINQTAAGHDWYVSASTGSSPAADDVDLLTVLEHELGHVLGLADNTQAGDLMDITLGLGVRRSPTSADLETLADASSTTIPATLAAVVPTNPPLPASLNGPVSVSVATMDAALASIVGAAVGDGDAADPAMKPGTPAVSMGPVPGTGMTPRKKDQSPLLARPYPRRTASSLFPRKGRGIGQASALDPRLAARAHGDSE